MVGRLFWGYLIDKLSFKVTFFYFFLILNVMLLKRDILQPTKLCFTTSCSFSILFGVTIYYISDISQPNVIYLFWCQFMTIATSGFPVLLPISVVRTFGQKYFGVIYSFIFLATVCRCYPFLSISRTLKFIFCISYNL